MTQQPIDQSPRIGTMPDEAFFHIRLGCPDDYPLIVDSWLQSDKSSPRGQDAGRGYMKGQKELIRSVLSNPAITIRIAHAPDQADAIMGWAVVELGPWPVIQYVYVKKPSRKLGIARSLLSDLTDRDAEYAYRPVFSGLPIPTGWTYNPYRAYAQYAGSTAGYPSR